MEVQAEISMSKNRELIGQELEVMVESHAPGQARLRGRTAAQAPDIDGMVFLRGEAEPGEFVRARIERAFTYDLHGQVIDAIKPSGLLKEGFPPPAPALLSTGKKIKESSQLSPPGVESDV